MAFLNNIGTAEIVIVGIVLIVLFGGKKMTEWAKGLGETGRELKKAKKEFTSSFEDTADKPEKRKGVE